MQNDKKHGGFRLNAGRKSNGVETVAVRVDKRLLPILESIKALGITDDLISRLNNALPLPVLPTVQQDKANLTVVAPVQISEFNLVIAVADLRSIRTSKVFYRDVLRLIRKAVKALNYDKAIIASISGDSMADTKLLRLIEVLTVDQQKEIFNWIKNN